MYPDARRIEGPGCTRMLVENSPGSQGSVEKSPQEASGAIFSGPEALEWTPSTFAAINGERSGLAC